MTFGNHLRSVREGLKAEDRKFSVRQVAQRVGIEPAYLSKIERNPLCQDTCPLSNLRVVKMGW